MGYPRVPVDGPLQGKVRELIHDLGRPVALIELNEGTRFYVPAAEGMYVGQEIVFGVEAPINLGNVLPLGMIPEGATVYNIERVPGDGGRFARSSGSYCSVVSQFQRETIVKLPSGKSLRLSKECLATIGVVGGSGRNERPFSKAGRKHHLLKTKGHVYPRTRGVAMVAAAHPFGGGSHQHPGKPTTVSKGAPPGRKVGLIAAKKSGRGRRK